MKIAYFINQYPKVSHSFIRREILALERQGMEVTRLALRGWSDDLVDPDDFEERNKTHYLLRRGLHALLPATFRQLLSRPTAFFRAMGMALRLSRMSDRAVPYHLVYLVEAYELVRLCQQRKVTHLHVHFGTNPTEVALLARMIGGPAFSFTVHGPDEFDRPLGLHLREKMEAAKSVVAISSYGRSQLYRWVGHSHWPKIQVAHCGLEASYFATPTEPFPTAPRFVCVGRLCEQKGQLLLLDAARQLRDNGEEFHLVLAGDGEMRGELEQFITRHNLQSHVSITGWISSERVKQELQAARAMVLPSFAEGLPVVIMEAMALGRPVLTTSIAGIPELVRHGIDGWLVPAGDVDALTNMLSRALATAPDKLQDMGLAARARVIERHSVDTEATKLRHIFSS
ncbi:MAG: glycosyltransferase [Acidovorax sp.]